MLSNNDIYSEHPNDPQHILGAADSICFSSHIDRPQLAVRRLCAGAARLHVCQPGLDDEGARRIRLPGRAIGYAGMQTIAALGLAAIPINHFILTRLLKMVGTVRRGDPFVADNAYRLNAIAWALLGLQLLSLVIGGIARMIS